MSTADSADPTRWNDAFAVHNGAELLDVSSGRATARLQVSAQHLNAHGMLHGGAIFALADVAFAAASNAHGIPAVAINVSISYLKAAREGVVTADAREISLSPRIGSYTVDVRNEQGELLAVFQGMVYRKPPPDARRA